MIILASASPRRCEILSEILGVGEFLVIPASIDERAVHCQDPAEYVRVLAERKADAVLGTHPEDTVLGADTCVCLDGRILGKPESGAEAADMLHALSGREHSVYTGWCLAGSGRRESGVTRTRVFFRTLAEDFIWEYIRSGAPMDKAGAYGIQDDPRLVEKYEGSYTNIVGLPKEEIREAFTAFGIVQP